MDFSAVDMDVDRAIFSVTGDPSGDAECYVVDRSRWQIKEYRHRGSIPSASEL
jgi:hypothetical protein